MRYATTVTASLVGLIGVLGARAAGAQAPPSVAAPSSGAARAAPDPVVDPAAYSGPNRAVIATGLASLALWYAPALYVATESNVPSDGNLAIPLLGPWLDLADRPQCGPGSVSCRVETGNETLLVIDGLFQAWALAAAVIGIFMREEPRATAGGVHVGPAQMGAGGYGVAAAATF